MLGLEQFRGLFSPFFKYLEDICVVPELFKGYLLLAHLSRADISVLVLLTDVKRMIYKWTISYTHQISATS